MTRDEIAVSKPKSLRKLYQEFGGSTTMHGIGRVISNSSTWKRVLWSAMVLVGLGFAVYQFVNTINDFYCFPVTTVVTLQHETKAMFPGITICNLNRKRKSKFASDLKGDISGFAEAEGAPLDTIYNVMLQSDTFTKYNQTGHQISDMLTKCLFNRLPCWNTNFSETDTATYGTCYTFQTDDPILQFTSRPGPQNGLILELNIEQYEYLPVTSKAGMKVIVHPTDEYPFPEDGGILARPGVATSIGIKKVITHRLPAPYSTCVGATGQGSSQHSLFPDKKYTQMACMKSCYQLTLFKKCNCCDVDLPCEYYNILNLDKTTNIDIHLPLCNATEQLLCKFVVEELFLKSELDCNERCPPACDRTTYDTVVSAALWPSDSRSEALAKFLNNTVLQNQSFTDRTSLEQFIRSNFLRLEIFLDSLEFLEFTTQAKYDWNLLLGTIGGLLGLWLGFSLLTAMEIVEVLVDTVVYCTRRKHKMKTTIQTETN